MVGSLNRMWNRILLREDDADAPVSDINSAVDLLPHLRDLRRVVLLAQQHNLYHLQGVPPLNGSSVDRSGDWSYDHSGDWSYDPTYEVDKHRENATPQTSAAIAR